MTPLQENQQPLPDTLSPEPPVAHPVTFSWSVALITLTSLALAGTLTWGAIQLQLVPALVFVAGSGGGVVASYLFDWIQHNQQLETMSIDGYMHTGLRYRLASTFLYWPFYSGRYSALTVAVLGAVFSGLAALVLGLFAGQGIGQLLSIFVAFLASQITYAVRRTIGANS